MEGGRARREEGSAGGRGLARPEGEGAEHPGGSRRCRGAELQETLVSCECQSGVAGRFGRGLGCVWGTCIVVFNT